MLVLEAIRVEVLDWPRPKADEKQRNRRARGRKWRRGAEEQEVDVLNYVDCEGRAALFSICED